MREVGREKTAGMEDGGNQEPKIFFPITAMSGKEKDSLTLGIFLGEEWSYESKVTGVNSQTLKPQRGGVVTSIDFLNQVMEQMGVEFSETFIRFSFGMEECGMGAGEKVGFLP